MYIYIYIHTPIYVLLHMYIYIYMCIYVHDTPRPAPRHDPCQPSCRRFCFSLLSLCIETSVFTAIPLCFLLLFLCHVNLRPQTVLLAAAHCLLTDCFWILDSCREAALPIDTDTSKLCFWMINRYPLTRNKRPLLPVTNSQFIAESIRIDRSRLSRRDTFVKR